jgi:hypothetical protein
MPAPSRFSIILLGVCALLCAALALLNYCIDPYNQYGTNTLGTYTTRDRQSKATDVQRFEHDAIILGNSREGMIPPGELDGFRFFNAAFGGGTAEEIYYFIEHFVKTEKLVLLGIDYGQGDPPQSQGDLYAPKPLSYYASGLLSLKTTEDSFKTITHKLAGKKPSLERDGTFNAEGWFQKYDVEIPNRAALQIEAMKRAYEAYEKAEPTSLLYYKKIAQLLRERNIPCVVYIPPLPTQCSAHLTNNTKPSFANWETEIGGIFPIIVNLALSPHGHSDNFFRSDLEHLKPDASAKIINQEVIPLCALEIKRTRRKMQHAN